LGQQIKKNNNRLCLRAFHEHPRPSGASIALPALLMLPAGCLSSNPIALDVTGTIATVPTYGRLSFLRSLPVLHQFQRTIDTTLCRVISSNKSRSHWICWVSVPPPSKDIPEDIPTDRSSLFGEAEDDAQQRR